MARTDRIFIVSFSPSYVMFFEGKLSSEKSVEVTDCLLSQQVTFNVAEKLDRLLVFWGGTTDSNGFMLEH